MFKVKYNLCPEILQGLFSRKSPSVKTNSTFHMAKIKSVYKGEMSLRYFGPVVWDTMIPDNIKQITDFSSFKEKISSWIPENCPCRLCMIYIYILYPNTFY